MPEEVRSFFTSLAKSSDTHAIKLMGDVLAQIQSSDLVGMKIVRNIDAMNFCEISLVDNDSMDNYVYTEDDLAHSSIHLSLYAHEMTAAHEFGHLLLDLFAENELPMSYFKVNKKIKKQLASNKKEISNYFQESRDYLFSVLLKAMEKSQSYFETHPEIALEYLSKNPEYTPQDIINALVADFYFYLVSLDIKARNINIVGNIIDSLYHGRNPFFKFYGNEVFHPLISSHDQEYYKDESEDKHFIGFEEQFAEYIVLRNYAESMESAISILKNLLGEDWFKMMDEYYQKIAQRIEDKKLAINR